MCTTPTYIAAKSACPIYDGKAPNFIVYFNIEGRNSFKPLQSERRFANQKCRTTPRRTEYNMAKQREPDFICNVDKNYRPNALHQQSVVHVAEIPSYLFL